MAGAFANATVCPFCSRRFRLPRRMEQNMQHTCAFRRGLITIFQDSRSFISNVDANSMRDIPLSLWTLYSYPNLWSGLCVQSFPHPLYTLRLFLFLFLVVAQLHLSCCIAEVPVDTGPLIHSALSWISAAVCRCLCLSNRLLFASLPLLISIRRVRSDMRRDRLLESIHDIRLVVKYQGIFTVQSGGSLRWEYLSWHE